MAERRKFETILTENKLVSKEQLEQVVRYAYAVGIDLCEAVLQKKIAPSDAVMAAYAESIGLPFVHLADISIDEDVVVQVDPKTVRQYSFVPVSIDQGHVLLATTKPVIPDVADELRMIFNLPVRCVICTPAELSAAIAQYYPRGATRIIQADRGKIPSLQPVTGKPKPIEQMSDAEQRDRLFKTVATFNFTVAFVYFASPFLPLPRIIVNSSSLTLLVGAILGGVTAFAIWKASSRYSV